MARRARAEVEGGLYHVITRGNNRRQMFDAPEDYEKFLSLLAVQRARLPFFLYAYCLMTNHVHPASFKRVHLVALLRRGISRKGAKRVERRKVKSTDSSPQRNLAHFSR